MSKYVKASTTKYIGNKVMCANHTLERAVDGVPRTAHRELHWEHQNVVVLSWYLQCPARGARSSIYCHS